MGRFINADVAEILTVQSVKNKVTALNLFTYSQNEPINNSDPLGLYNVAYEANWLINTLFAGIAALKVSGAALAAKVSAMILTIAPYLFWIVVAVAAVVVIYFLARTVAISKADAKIRSKVKRGKNARYWTATLRVGYVDLGREITYAKAVAEVSAGRNVFTITSAHAKAVAKAAYSNKKPVGPEIDKGKGNTKGYYYHYHVYGRKKKGHVFFLFW